MFKTPTFQIEFKTDNAAFQHEDPAWSDQARADEVARILRSVADYVENQGRTSGDVRDANGNKVGEWAMTGGEA